MTKISSILWGGLDKGGLRQRGGGLDKGGLDKEGLRQRVIR